MKRALAARRAAVTSEPLVDINTTPLIDVMLVLLIMLIITIPVQLHSVNLNMPRATPPQSLQKPDVLRIDVDSSSRVLFNGEPVGGALEMEMRMQAEAAKPVQPEIHLRPDRKAKYEVVASVLASAQRTKLEKIGVVGSEQFEP